MIATIIISLTCLLIFGAAGWLVNKWLDLNHSLNTTTQQQRLEAMLVPLNKRVADLEAIKEEFNVLRLQIGMKRT